MDEIYTSEVAELYGPMPFEVKLLWGEEDQWIPAAQGHKLSDKLTQGQISVIEGAGHLVQEDRPEAILAAVLAN